MFHFSKLILSAHNNHKRDFPEVLFALILDWRTTAFSSIPVHMWFNMDALYSQYTAPLTSSRLENFLSTWSTHAFSEPVNSCTSPDFWLIRSLRHYLASHKSAARRVAITRRPLYIYTVLSGFQSVTLYLTVECRSNIIMQVKSQLAAVVNIVFSFRCTWFLNNSYFTLRKGYQYVCGS